MKTKSTISSNLHDIPAGNGLRLLSLRTSAKDIVTIRGSLLGGRRFSPKQNPMLAEITVAMLEEGTKKRSKQVLHEELESLGAVLSISSGLSRVHIAGRCLREDVPKLLEILAEELREPAFKEANLAIVKKRFIATIREGQNETGPRAIEKLQQLLFSPSHPNYAHSGKARVAAVEKTTVRDLKNFHQKNYGLGNIILVVVGDVPEKELARATRKHFFGWKTSSLSAKTPVSKPLRVKSTVEYIHLSDKTSVDVFSGRPLALTSSDPDFHPLYLGLYVLGGNFLSRLMQEIREKRGLTYGTYARLHGTYRDISGWWHAWATFAPSLLNKGLRELSSVTRQWLLKGITEKELALKKEAITGEYRVGLATTVGLAETILANTEEGRPKEFIDKYPEIIKRLTLREVNDAIKKYAAGPLVTVAAGTIEKSK